MFVSLPRNDVFLDNYVFHVVRVAADSIGFNLVDHNRSVCAYFALIVFAGYGFEEFVESGSSVLFDISRDIIDIFSMSKCSWSGTVFSYIYHIKASIFCHVE